MFLDITH
jgi:uncharacterized coiled-coil protein SlyX